MTNIDNLISHARSLPNGRHEHIPYENIGEMLFKQCRFYDTKPYLIFYNLEGDRIATISHNHSDTVIQYYAAWLLGACVVPISLSEDNARIKYILDHSKAKLAFVRADYAERLSEVLIGIETVICRDVPLERLKG